MDNTNKVSNSISWYRIPLKGESLRGLSQRSDLMGLLQACGHLGLLVSTGAAAFYANGRLPLPVLLFIIFLHGTFYKFILNGFHELCHSSVFKSKALNIFFLKLYSFLGWYDPVMFWTSHSEHHKYTLHQPDDLEVVMPIKYTLLAFLKSAFVNPIQFFISLETNIRFSFGKISKKDMPGEWEVDDLFPPTEVGNRRRLFNWARTLLVGHGIIIGISIYTGLWLLPVLITFGRFYGGWLLFFCNNCQHVGLQDKVPDFRLCCWTVILNPFVQFLYWHMNYHIEHHMYAAVPCYNLGKLHRAIEYDLPKSPNGLYAVWKKIVETLKKQKADPDYHYVPELPETQKA